MIRVALILLISATFPHQAWAYRSQDTRVLAECQWNAELFDLKADCNDLFHHYLPTDDNYRPDSSDVRMGSFNIYKMGSGESKFKRLDLIAQMINARWDVVALSEVQHNASDKLVYNSNAVRAFREGKIDKEIAQKSYRKPDYLRLLHFLQEIDPSWGLIVSPFGQNPSLTSSNDELYAFLYRKQQIQPTVSTYCQNHLDERLKAHDGKIPVRNWMTADSNKGVERIQINKPLNDNIDFEKPTGDVVACPLNLKDDEQKYFPRVPLVASFKSGNFDFNYFSLHLRFRSPDTVVGGKCEEECMETLEKMAKLAGAPDHYDVAKLKAKPSNEKPRLSGNDLKEIARMFEAFVTLKEAKKIRKINKDNDVIITGDFNLQHFDIPASNVTPDLNGTSGELVSILAILPDAKSYVSKKTSISKKFGIEGKLKPDGSRQGGGNSYDHFIVVNKPGFTSECDVGTAKRVDFVKDSSVKNQMKIDGIPFDQYYKNPDNFEDIIEWTLDSFFKGRFRIDRRGTVHDMSHMDDLSSDVLSNKYNNCITGTKKESMTLAAGVVMDLRCQLIWHSELANKTMLTKPDKEKTKEKFRIYTGLMSDHVPVEMTCNSPSTDDD